MVSRRPVDRLHLEPGRRQVPALRHQPRRRRGSSADQGGDGGRRIRLVSGRKDHRLHGGRPGRPGIQRPQGSLWRLRRRPARIHVQPYLDGGCRRGPELTPAGPPPHKRQGLHRGRIRLVAGRDEDRLQRCRQPRPHQRPDLGYLRPRSCRRQGQKDRRPARRRFGASLVSRRPVPSLFERHGAGRQLRPQFPAGPRRRRGRSRSLADGRLRRESLRHRLDRGRHLFRGDARERPPTFSGSIRRRSTSPASAVRTARTSPARP